MLTDGWEFFILNPFDLNVKQSTQDKYIDMYNKAYDAFMSQLCIPKPNDLLEDAFDFMYRIDLSGDNDKVELEEEYEYTFLKSVFLDKKFKKIRGDVMGYYNMHNIHVLNIYKLDDCFYIILNKK